MSFKGKVNEIRRKIMQGATQAIGKSTNPALIDKDQIINTSRILISRPNNRLGNQILISPLIQELIEVFPNCKIDLFVRGGASTVLFQNYENVDKIIKLPGKPFNELNRYIRVWIKLRENRDDIAVNIDNRSSSGRLSTRFVRAKVRIFGDEEQLNEKYPDYIHIAKKPVYNLRHLLLQVGINRMDKPIPDLSIKLSPSELENGKKVLDAMMNPLKKTICIYTFATGGKCYSKEWWADTYSHIKNKYAEEYNILEVLPKENVSQIDFAEPTYYSVDLREIAAVIANSAIFIGADSGMMHLASASGAPTVGLFSLTCIPMYEPYNGKSTAFDTNKGNAKDLIAVMDSILNT